ncbi:MAG: lipoyl synthase, partial [ANME-2 cluster archaeon]
MNDKNNPENECLPPNNTYPKGKLCMKPEWLRTNVNTGRKFPKTVSVLRELGLTTVCQGAYCPNKYRCWGSGTATFMILGTVCTRNCRFCTVPKGTPDHTDPTEPLRLATAVERLSLKYVVITSVDRDDLDDKGAGHFASCVVEVRKTRARVEILIPDYVGVDLETVVDSGPDVIGHNIEVVSRLTPEVRDLLASYEKSLCVLREVKRLDNRIKTKSSLMLGIGETDEEVIDTMHDLRDAGVDMLTLGQYLRPSKNHIPVSRYVTPAEFSRFGKIAREMDF